jgi:hypothetical protein
VALPNSSMPLGGVIVITVGLGPPLAKYIPYRCHLGEICASAIRSISVAEICFWLNVQRTGVMRLYIAGNCEAKKCE